MKRPTDRQGEVVAAIAALTRELRRAPSAQEVADRMGMTREGLRVHLRALEAKGLAYDEPREVRSGNWRLTQPGKLLARKRQPRAAICDMAEVFGPEPEPVDE